MNNYQHEQQPQLIGLFETPVRSRKVRSGVTAYQYPNGCVNIAGQKYYGYTFAEAISKYRTQYPKYKKA